jgi:transposase-like protein
MTSFRCKKCGSINIKKNGRTPSGQQQYHCHDCGVYTTTDTVARDYARKLALVEHLHTERVSQRGIARVSGVSRPTIIKWLKKSPAADRGYNHYLS